MHDTDNFANCGGGLLFGVGAARAQGNGGDLCDKIRALTNDPAVAMAHWGVSVTTLDGTALCSISEAQLFRPASNDKLFTMAAALALLGPERRFQTSVVAEGELKDGVLKGNLKLVGGGDPDFGSADVPYVEPLQRPKTPVPEPPTIADIEELADKVVAKGLRRVEGDVVGTSYFAWEPYPVGWGIDDLTPGYGAPVSGLTIHDNEVEIEIAPDPVKAGNEAAVTVAPEVAYYTIRNDATTGPVDRAHPGATVAIEREVGSRTISIEGNVPLNAATVKRDLAIQDPDEYAALALLLALERRGVKVTGTGVSYHAPIGPGKADPSSEAEKEAAIRQASYERVCSGSAVDSGPAPTVLATHASPRLADDVVYTAKESQNLHAEILMRDLGRMWAPVCGGLVRTPIGQETVRAAVGMGMVRAYLAVAGIATTDFALYDGSGLSGHDLVAPRAFTQLLVYAAKQKWFETFKAALPVGGVDGTLANRFLPPDSKLKGKVFAKTGTLGESRALSGYVTTAGGETLVFSVMADNHPPGTAADRVAMDKIVEAIAARN